MAEQSAFLTAFDEMQKKKGGFNAPAPVAPGFKPQVPQELSTQQFGPTLASEAQLPVEQRTQDGTMIGVPDFNEPYIVPEAAQAFGDVPVNMPSNPLDPNAQISAAQDRLPSTPSEVIPRGGVRTRGTGGEQSPMAAARVGGIAESESEFGLLDTFRDVINPSEEQKAANLAAGARTGGVQVLPAEPLTPEGVPAATPEVMATPESIADLSVNGTDVVTPEAITEAGPVAPQAQAPQSLNSTQAMLQERFGSPTISGIQSAEEGLGLRTDAQGRMIDPNVDRSSFEQASADREARQAARPDFGTAVSDRDRRAARGEGISDADRRDIAKAQSPNASASDRARGMKVAEKAGLDWRTGQPLKQDKETGGLTDYQAITAQQRQTEIDLKIADGMEEREAKRAVAYEESRSNVRSTQDSFDKLRPVAEEIALLSGSKFTEGALGWTASKLPFSTDAAQIERLTTEFEGSAFLQGLIDAKAKGATFGALSEREGDRILGQWGKITSPKSTNPERIRAVNSMLESIQRSSERAASDHKEKFPDRSARSSKATAQGSPEGKRHAKDQDHGAKVETYFQT